MINKKLITIGIIFLMTSIAGKFIFSAIRNIKIDEFHKASVIIVLDTSSLNKDLSEKENYIKSLCAILDPEDSIKILKSAQSAYLIYEGTPSDSAGIKKAIHEFTNDITSDTSYGEGIKKAIDYNLTMKKDGYTPSIIIIGSLENKGDISKQINWDTLPSNISKAKQYIPDLTMMFVYGHPEKLDLVKTKLNPVLGEKKLIVANKANIDKANRRFLDAIGR